MPSANVLGQVGAGFIYAMQALDGGRVGLGAACVGGTRAALEWMASYASIREQFRPQDRGEAKHTVDDRQFGSGAGGAHFPGLSHGLDGGHGPAVHAAGGSLQAARFGSPRGPSTGPFRSTGAWATTVIFRSSGHGGRSHRRVFEGTDEIQRLVIAEQVLAPYGVRVRP